MSTTGRMPALARPAAKATACDSQMPTSKKRSGKFSRIRSSLLPWHMAAVMMATRRSSSIAVVQGMADGVGVRLGPAAFQGQDCPLRPHFFEHRRGVVGDRVGSGLRHAVALVGQDVEQNRALLIADVAEPAAHTGQVVAVYRADVLESQLLEEHAARQEGLHAVLDLLEPVRRRGCRRGIRASRSRICRLEPW